MGDDNPSEKGKQKKPGVFTSGFLAPPTDERWSYNAMIEYVTIRKLTGFS